MGLIGGPPGYWFLKTFYPNGQGVPMSSTFVPEEEIRKLHTFFSAEELADLRGKTVIDFGCGQGFQSIAMARDGARVIAIDTDAGWRAKAAELARQYGVADRVTVAEQTHERADVIISVDAFEHFADPAQILRQMRGLLRDDGYVLVSFGYTWYHPLGGHLFSVFPWAHLLFTEGCLMRWRADFKTDGATCFAEVQGGLNRMTVGRWYKLLEESPFEVEWERIRPIRTARRLYCRWTRELLTSTMQFKLRPKG